MRRVAATPYNQVWLRLHGSPPTSKEQCDVRRQSDQTIGGNGLPWRLLREDRGPFGLLPADRAEKGRHHPQEGQAHGYRDAELHATPVSTRDTPQYRCSQREQSVRMAQVSPRIRMCGRERDYLQLNKYNVHAKRGVGEQLSREKIEKIVCCDSEKILCVGGGF